MGHIERKFRRLHDLAGFCGLGLALGREGHIVPASKEIQFVPRTLAVAEEDKISKHVAIVRRPANVREFWVGQMLSHPISSFLSQKLYLSQVRLILIKSIHAEPGNDEENPPWQKQ